MVQLEGRVTGQDGSQPKSRRNAAGTYSFHLQELRRKTEQNLSRLSKMSPGLIGYPPSSYAAMPVYRLNGNPYINGYATNGYGCGGRTGKNGSEGSTATGRGTPSSAGSPRIAAGHSATNLYIRGLPPDATDAYLFDLCAKYGKIMSTKSIMDKATGTCKGYGFVDFESAEVAEAAMKALKEQRIDASMAKTQEQDPTNLYIANLPSHWTEEHLEELFAPFGSVVSTRVLRDEQRNSRGVGFARMEYKERCDEIIKQMNGKVPNGATERLLIKFADSAKAKKQKQVADAALLAPAANGYTVLQDSYLNNYESSSGAGSAGRSLPTSPVQNGTNGTVANRYGGVAGAGLYPAATTYYLPGGYVLPAYQPVPNPSQTAAATGYEGLIQGVQSMSLNGGAGGATSPATASFPYMYTPLAYPASTPYFHLAADAASMQVQMAAAAAAATNGHAAHELNGTAGFDDYPPPSANYHLTVAK